MTEHGTMWVCIDCMIAHANGDAPTEPCGCETPHVPWQIDQGPGVSVTMGILGSEDEYGPRHWQDNSDEHEWCETRDFSTNACDGCGCPLAGTRHAFTWSRPCGVCGGFADISRVVGTEVAPGVYTYERRDVPCPRCYPDIRD